MPRAITDYRLPIADLLDYTDSFCVPLLLRRYKNGSPDFTMKTKQPYDYICFGNLAYEFNISDKQDVEKKIKRRLKYYEAGAYDQERVEYMRAFKDALYLEIQKTEASQFFKKIPSQYCELKDFDVEKMVDFFSSQFNRIDSGEMYAMANFGVYLWYLR